MEEDYKSMRDAERHEGWERYGEYGPPRYVQILRFIPWVLSGLLVVGVIIYFLLSMDSALDFLRFPLSERSFTLSPFSVAIYLAAITRGCVSSPALFSP